MKLIKVRDNAVYLISLILAIKNDFFGAENPPLMMLVEGYQILLWACQA